MIPRFGPPPQVSQSYRPRPGAYAVLPLGGRVLLTHQSQPAPEFQLPGGGIDPGESPVQALHREVFEETGYRISQPRRLGAFRRFVYMPEYDMWAEKLCHVFVARPCLRIGTPSEPFHTVAWVRPAKVAGMLGNEGDAHFAAQVL
jgi:8-oxo-dGTP diphosphatase